MMTKTERRLSAWRWKEHGKLQDVVRAAKSQICMPFRCAVFQRKNTKSPWELRAAFVHFHLAAKFMVEHCEAGKSLTAVAEYNFPSEGTSGARLWF